MSWRANAAGLLRLPFCGPYPANLEGESGEAPDCQLVKQVVAPIIEAAGQVFLDKLETITIDDICRRAEDLKLWDEKTAGADFAI